MQRRRSVGAEVHGSGVHFRVWAPAHEAVAVVIDDRDHPLDREPRGYFSVFIEGARAGTRYVLRVGDELLPDPASRFQPEGPHGPSQVIDPTTFRWTAGSPDAPNRVIYEMHIGTFTREGTFAAAIAPLRRLASLGINVLELMPVNEFPGRFGWGYDGVDLWAPYHVYGEPDDFRRFVDAAHSLGLAVILDVVYNHLGPDGNYLAKFTPRYFTDKYANDWGDSINFDGDDAHGVRDFFAENAAYWIDEFRLDGLRLDATQSILDASEKHILREITDRARAAAPDRAIHIVAENEPQDSRLIREYGVDAMWNDDWHHAARVALTDSREAYYTDYRGSAQEFVSMAKLGFLFQGQYYSWQKKRRGTSSHDLEPDRFVCCLDNHDQVANSADGLRIDRRTSRGRYRAMTALLLLQPQTPMLFQGQEFGARSPFVYFADHGPELATLVAKGRREFMSQFPSVDVAQIPDPEKESTFEDCRLDHDDVREDILELHRSLLALRRQHPFRDAQRVDGAVLGDRCFVLRWPDRLLVVNLGDVIDFHPASEPLLAPPPGAGAWSPLWTSEDLTVEEWRIPAECAVVLAPTGPARSRD